MAKTVKGFEIDDDGRMHQYRGLSRSQRKSGDADLIPWTKGPTSRWQKIKRAAVG